MSAAAKLAAMRALLDALGVEHPPERPDFAQQLSSQVAMARERLRLLEHHERLEHADPFTRRMTPAMRARLRAARAAQAGGAKT